MNIVIFLVPAFEMELVDRSLQRFHDGVPDFKFVDLLAEVLHLSLDPVDVVHELLATRVVDPVRLPTLEKLVS